MSESSLQSCSYQLEEAVESGGREAATSETRCRGKTPAAHTHSFCNFLCSFSASSAARSLLFFSFPLTPILQLKVTWSRKLALGERGLGRRRRGEERHG